VGAKGFAGTEEIQTAAVDVHYPVGDEGDPVSDGQSPGRVGDVADFAEIEHGAHDVGVEGQPDQPVKMFMETCRDVKCITGIRSQMT
jgi:hypothetical protein